VTLTRQEVRRLLVRYGLRPSKVRGQHFVVDPNTVRRVVRLAEVAPGDRVVEVGAGLGSLTLALAEAGAAVTAVEIDHGLVAALRDVVASTGTRVVEADAMRLDWGELLGQGPWTLVSNLPYNVATPLIADLLDDVPAIERMLVMVQREVGERLVARPGDAAYGAVSVKVTYWARARIVGRVPSTVFLPEPKVESALVEIKRRPTPAVEEHHDRGRLFELVGAGFGGRRKMLRRALAGVLEPADIAAAGVRPEARAEELSVEDWGRLAIQPRRRDTDDAGR